MLVTDLHDGYIHYILYVYNITENKRSSIRQPRRHQRRWSRQTMIPCLQESHKQYKMFKKSTAWSVELITWVNTLNDVIMSTMASQITSLAIAYFNGLFKRRSKETSKLRVPSPCDGNSPVTGEFPVERASNAENVSICWRHQDFANQDN